MCLKVCSRCRFGGPGTLFSSNRRAGSIWPGRGTPPESTSPSKRRRYYYYLKRAFHTDYNPHFSADCLSS